MLIVEELIKQPREERMKHVDLSLPCLERGGSWDQHRGVLAQFLNTNLPYTPKGTLKICMCHACNNSKCSEPRHLYWGTAKENLQDAFDCGVNQNIHKNTVAKYGLEETKRMAKANGGIRKH